MGLGTFISGAISSVSNFCSGVCSVCSNIGKSIGDFAGKAFSSAFFPTLELLEVAVKIIGAVIGAIAEILGLKEVDETPEEIGMKAEEAANQGVKPENFDSYEEYLIHLRENIDIDKSKLDNLSDEDKLKYMAIGSSILVKGIEEKERIEIPAEFVAEIAKQKLEADEVREYIKSFRDNGVSLSDFTGFFKGTLDSNQREKVGNTIEDVIGNLNSEITEEQVEDKIDEMIKKSNEEYR